MRLVVLGNRPAAHPALYLLEQLLGRVATPPVARGRITLYINGGRITDIHPEYLLPAEPGFTLAWRPLTPAQQAAVQAVADVLPELEQARADCRLVLRVRRGQPHLPLIYQGRYGVSYPPGSHRSARPPAGR